MNLKRRDNPIMILLHDDKKRQSSYIRKTKEIENPVEISDIKRAGFLTILKNSRHVDMMSASVMMY